VAVLRPVVVRASGDQKTQTPGQLQVMLTEERRVRWVEGFQPLQSCRCQCANQVLVPDLPRMRQDRNSASLLDQLDGLNRPKVSAGDKGGLPSCREYQTLPLLPFPIL